VVPRRRHQQLVVLVLVPVCCSCCSYSVVVVLLVVHVLIVAVVFQGLVVNIKLGAVDSVLNINLPVLIPSSVLLLTVRKSSLGVAVGQAPLYKDRT
jgi:hypothetical protein